MKWLNRLAALLFGLISVGVIKDVRSKYDLIILDKENLQYEEDEEDMEHISGLRPENYDNAMDLRGRPTHACICGCNIFNIKAIFDDYEIATYFLDMECVNCGTLVTAPTPLDREETDL